MMVLLMLGVDTSRIVLSFSGLDEAEACWIRRLLRAIGITHAPTFTRRTTHLLCPSREGKKFEKAPEWGIEVVGMEWLHAVAREGRVPGKVAAGVGKVAGGKAGSNGKVVPNGKVTNGGAKGKAKA